MAYFALILLAVALWMWARRLGERLQSAQEGKQQALAAAAAAADQLQVAVAERHRLGRAVAGMAEGVLVVDGRGCVESANPAFAAMLDVAELAVGHPLSHSLRHAGLRQLLDAAAAQRQPAMGEIAVGELRPKRLLVKVAPLGEGLLATAVDVTQLRQLESHRREFVANVSHELRTPLAAVRGAAESLQFVLPTGEDPASEFLAMIERNAARLQALVDDLLHLAKLERADYAPQLAVLNVREQLQAAADRAQLPLGHAATPEVTVAADPALLVRAEAKGLQQALGNLIDNGRKYAGAGPIALSAVAKDGVVELSVADSGPGIAAEHLPRLFERFYRADTGRSRQLGGTGLGLAIVKHAVEAMGGTVGVDSEAGQGARFWIRLPAA